MKDGNEAAAQYSELEVALSEVAAGWVAEEVDEVVSRGKRVAFRDLPRDEQSRYEARLQAETQKGLSVGKARGADEIGIPYAADERLALLVDATERVVAASVRSHVYVSEFAAEHDLQAVALEAPVSVDAPPRVESRRTVPMIALDDVDDRLEALHRTLHNRVIE